MKVNRTGKAKVLTLEEKQLIRAVLPGMYQTIFDVAWYTGERWGAIIKLKFIDVYEAPSMPRNLITYPASTRKRGGGKAATTRQVFIHPELRSALIDYKGYSNYWMFPGPGDKNSSITFQAVDKQLRAALSRVGLANKGISSHSTRRSFITNLYRQGVGLRELMKLTGHKSISALLEYVEDDPAVQQQIIMRLT